MSELLSIQSRGSTFFSLLVMFTFCFTSLVAASHYFRLPMVYNMFNFDNLFLPGDAYVLILNINFFCPSILVRSSQKDVN